MKELYALNTPERFWRLCEPLPSRAWELAVQEAMAVLPGDLTATNGNHTIESLLLHTLGESQFGPSHWQLSPPKRVYYRVRPFLPSQFRPMLRQFFVRGQRKQSVLGWPIEDRYVRFQFGMVNALLKNQDLDAVSSIDLWPGGKRFAFVLTHDIESNSGQEFVRNVVELEEQFGFHSSFNFVVGDYTVDPNLVAELRTRGFEVGIHGLKHDGRLFSSHQGFLRQADQINQYLKMWRVVGFRSPMTHRHPEWMQALDIEYDSSFFDTDPFEPIAGGTMSIWPFFIGHFVELPYTLAQDHTLTQTLGETTPRLWLEKVDFVRRYYGMALLNSHPDYLRKASNFTMYEEFLHRVSEKSDYWHALPREVASWWRQRAQAKVMWGGKHWTVEELPGATIGEIRCTERSAGACIVTKEGDDGK